MRHLPLFFWVITLNELFHTVVGRNTVVFACHAACDLNERISNQSWQSVYFSGNPLSIKRVLHTIFTQMDTSMNKYIRTMSKSYSVSLSRKIEIHILFDMSIFSLEVFSAANDICLPQGYKHSHLMLKHTISCFWQLVKVPTVWAIVQNAN